MVLNFFSFLLYLLPLALVTGPFLSDLIASSLGLFFLVISFKNKLWGYYQNKFIIIFFIFYTYILLRSLLSSEPLFSLESSLFYFRFIFFILAIAYIFDNNKNAVKYTFISLNIIILIVCIDAFYQFIFGKNLIGYERIQPYNYLSGFFGTENILGSYLSRLLCFYFALAFILLRRNNLNYWLTMILPALMFFITFLSGERAAFFLISIAFLIILLLVDRYKIQRFITLLILFLILITSVLLIPKVKDRMITQTISSFGLSEQSEQIYIFSKGHHALILSGYKMFKSNPFFGKGPKMFRKLCDKPEYVSYYPEYHCSTHPHNTYIQILSETGLFGLIPILTLFVFISFKLFKQFLKKYIYTSLKYNILDYKICLYASIFINLWPFISTGSFFNNWLSILYFLPLGLLLTMNKISNE